MKQFAKSFTIEEWRMIAAALMTYRRTVFRYSISTDRLQEMAHEIAEETGKYDANGESVPSFRDG